MRAIYIYIYIYLSSLAGVRFVSGRILKEVEEIMDNPLVANWGKFVFHACFFEH